MIYKVNAFEIVYTAVHMRVKCLCVTLGKWGDLRKACTVQHTKIAT